MIQIRLSSGENQRIEHIHDSHSAAMRVKVNFVRKTNTCCMGGSENVLQSMCGLNIWEAIGFSMSDSVLENSAFD